MDNLLAFELAANAANRCAPHGHVMVKVGLSIGRDGDHWFVAYLGNSQEFLSKDEAIDIAMGILIKFYAPIADDIPTTLDANTSNLLQSGAIWQ